MSLLSKFFAGFSLFLVGIALGSNLNGWGEEEQSTQRDSTSQTNFKQPSRELMPDEVVRIQMQALQRFLVDKGAIEQCYVFASPANRAVTGPLYRFTAMVQSEAFRSLTANKSFLVGKAVIHESKATVLVTVLGTDFSVKTYRFFLSQQDQSPYEDCWMTEAVYPLQEGTAQPASPVDESSAAGHA